MTNPYTSTFIAAVLFESLFLHICFKLPSSFLFLKQQFIGLYQRPICFILSILHSATFNFTHELLFLLAVEHLHSHAALALQKSHPQHANSQPSHHIAHFCTEELRMVHEMNEKNDSPVQRSQHWFSIWLISLALSGRTPAACGNKTHWALTIWAAENMNRQPSV